MIVHPISLISNNQKQINNVKFKIFSKVYSHSAPVPSWGLRFFPTKARQMMPLKVMLMLFSDTNDGTKSVACVI